MSWVAVAAAVAGPVIGGLIGSSGAQSAADTQASAADRASANTMTMFNTQQKNLAPWMTGGGAGLNALLTGLGLPGGSMGTEFGTTPLVVMTPNGPMANPDLMNNPNAKLAQDYGMAFNQATSGSNLDASGNPNSGMWDPTQLSSAIASRVPQGTPGAQGTPGVGGITTGMFTQPFTPSQMFTDPSYQWRLNQGQDALLNKASAIGGVQGGNTMKALTDYSQGAASQEYSAMNDRYNTYINNLFSRLSSLSGTGANAAGGIANLGMGANQQSTNALLSGAASTAAGQMGSANALAGGLGGASNNYLIAQMMARMNQPNYGTTPGDPNVYGGSGGGTVPMSFDPNQPY